MSTTKSPAAEDALPRSLDEELARTRDHLARAQRVGGVGSAEVDLVTGREYWSDEFYRILGHQPQSFPPNFERFLALVHPNDREVIKDIRTRTERGEIVPASEFRIRRPDGQERWLRRNAERIRDEKGRVFGTTVCFLDITERKNIEEELLESRRHLAMAQRVGHIGSVEVDIATETALWSDEFFHILGLRKTPDTSFELFLSAVHPEDRAGFVADRDMLQQGRPVPAREHRIIRSNGEVRWLYRHVEIIRDESGVAKRHISTFTDVTELKRVELALRRGQEELRQSEQRLERAQAVGATGSSEIDLKTGVRHWSKQYYRLLGLDPAKAIPSRETFLAAVLPEDRDKLYMFTDLASQRGPIEPVIFRVRRPDGEVRWLRRQAEVVRDAQGDPRHLVFTLLDITDVKRAQDERASLQEQLAQAQKMEAVGKLSGGIAHDFNNLLSVIVGRLELLREDLSNRPDLIDSIASCLNAASRGATLTRSLLAFSRQQPLQPIDMDMQAALGDLFELLPRALGESIEIELHFADDLWRCEADPAQLQNALLNLAINARDAMPDGGRLTIEASNESVGIESAASLGDLPPGDYVALSVTDTGFGMSPEVLSRAVEPFFTTKDVGKGSGLGLSMVYGFATQSGGHLEITSETGTGTTVRLLLPRSAETKPAEAPAAASPVASASPATILVVEDDDDMRLLTSVQLKRLGYVPITAANPAEALRIVEGRDDIRLLLSDMILPGGLNGRALADKVVAQRPEMRILFMSGYSDDALIHDGRLDADLHFLQKPFGIAELAEAISGALK